MATFTRSVPTTSVTAVTMVLSDLGDCITDQHSTQGACGYTTITYTTKEPGQELVFKWRKAHDDLYSTEEWAFGYDNHSTNSEIAAMNSPIERPRGRDAGTRRRGGVSMAEMCPTAEKVRDEYEALIAEKDDEYNRIDSRLDVLGDENADLRNENAQLREALIISEHDCQRARLTASAWSDLHPKNGTSA